MRLVPVLVFALFAANAVPVRAAGDDTGTSACATALDFRLVGSWIAEDGIERKSFMPESRSQTPAGQPVSTETCMASADDVEEFASVEIAPHLRSVTESHYHIGFIGLDRVLVTFPSGAMQFFRRIVAAPGRAFNAVTHHHRT